MTLAIVAEAAYDHDVIDSFNLSPYTKIELFAFQPIDRSFER